MIKWVLLIILWNGQVMDGTPVDTFKTLKECKAALTMLLKEVGPPPDEAQAVCWPDAAVEDKKGSKGAL